MSDLKKHAVILIPCHQPDEKLIELCQALEGFAIVFVDDGSGEADNRFWEQIAPYATVLHGEGKGRHAALKHGLRYIGECEAYADHTVIVTANPDSHSADVLRVAEQSVAQGGMVFGTRTDSSLLRRLSTLFFRIASGKSVSDPTTGLRAFPKDRALQLADLPGGALSFEMNHLFAAIEDKLPMTELPVDAPSQKSSFLYTVRSCFAMFLGSRTLKYLFSSGVAFLIDYVLLVLLARIFSFDGAVELVAAPVAWMVSSLTNFFLNRNFVFRSTTPFLVALPEYYGLAAVVFLLKTYVLLELMVRGFGIPLAVAKPVAEVIFFISNYFIQKKFIFKKKQAPDSH